MRVLVHEEGRADDGGGDGDAAGRGLAGTVHPTEEEAVVSQKHLILVYAKNQLRPPNMGGLYAWNLKL